MTITYTKAYKDYESRGITFTYYNTTTNPEDGLVHDVPTVNRKLKGHGDQVVYLGTGGYDGDKIHADKYLEFTQVLTIETHRIGNYSSTYTFKEFPNHSFNTVMFE